MRQRFNWRGIVLQLWAFAASVMVIWFSVYSLHTAGEARSRSQDLRAAICPFYKDIAALPVSPKSSDLGRGIVRDAADAYARLCVSIYGPLPPVDPEAYKTAPPASNISPSSRVR